MLTVLSNIVRQTHDRVGTGAHNKPELRQKLVVEAIQRTFSECQILLSSKTVSDEWLANVHDKSYIEFLEYAFTEWQKMKDPDWEDSTGGLVPNHFYKRKPHADVPVYKLSGWFGTDTMTPIFKDTYQNAMIAAQQAYRAADMAVEAEENSVVYVLACSPGHHANFNEYGGYCFVNNACVAAYRLLELGKTRVAILDIDFHAGQGTASLVITNPKFKGKVMACSIHVDPSVDYPSFEGYEDDYPDNEYVVNVPLNSKAGWEEYQDALETVCDKIKKWAPDGLIIAFGADTYKEDPDASSLGRFSIEMEDYDKMGQTIRSKFACIPIIVTQEGGYCMEKVPEIVCRFLKNLIPGS